MNRLYVSIAAGVVAVMTSGCLREDLMRIEARLVDISTCVEDVRSLGHADAETQASIAGEARVHSSLANQGNAQRAALQAHFDGLRDDLRQMGLSVDRWVDAMAELSSEIGGVASIGRAMECNTADIACALAEQNHHLSEIAARLGVSDAQDPASTISIGSAAVAIVRAWRPFELSLCLCTHRNSHGDFQPQRQCPKSGGTPTKPDSEYRACIPEFERIVRRLDRIEAQLERPRNGGLSPELALIVRDLQKLEDRLDDLEPYDENRDDVVRVFKVQLARHKAQAAIQRQLAIPAWAAYFSSLLLPLMWTVIVILLILGIVMLACDGRHRPVWTRAHVTLGSGFGHRTSRGVRLMMFAIAIAVLLLGGLGFTQYTGVLNSATAPSAENNPKATSQPTDDHSERSQGKAEALAQGAGGNSQ